MNIFYHKRKIYQDRLEPFIGAPLIKVITGMRRTGKSVFLRQVSDILLDRGENPLLINMELMENHRFRDLGVLHEHITRLDPSAVIIDEVQDIENWEELAASLLAEGGMDIYLSGSNAGMLTSDLASKISGRYVQLRIYPLGLAEYIQFRGDDAGHLEDVFQEYLRFGGMPGIHSMELKEEVIYQYLKSVLDTVVLNDVIIRNGVRNAALLESVLDFLADNIGSLYTGKSIADYLTSAGRKTTAGTVIEYVSFLVNAFALHHVKRFDLRGKRQLAYTGKAYLNDLSFRHAIFGYRGGAVSGFLENIVYMELLRRNYAVYVGSLADREVDFVAEKDGNTFYLQVAYLLASPETVEREFSALRTIPDNYPKMVLSMDRNIPSRTGINQIYIPDFLIDPNKYLR